MRPEAILKLLNSVRLQSLYPDEIIIVDGSDDDKTKHILAEQEFENLQYIKVDASERGLTKQRNLGIKNVRSASDIICFLDDDIVLKHNYFEELIATYESKPKALAVGGYILNDTKWAHRKGNDKKKKFYYDGWMRKEPMRFKVRRFFGLLPDTSPGFLPTFAHGRSVGFLPPSGKIYEVEQLMGGVSSYKKEIFRTMSFSSYFQGYGLYEDADFTIRLAKIGSLYVNTNAQLYHYHHEAGRPNKYNYGKMVIRNGWYVWRTKYPKPTFTARVKWNCCAILLLIIRLTNVFTFKQKKAAFTESLGRLSGLFSLIFNKPNLR